jgi:hypothetical protein
MDSGDNHHQGTSHPQECHRAFRQTGCEHGQTTTRISHIATAYACKPIGIGIRLTKFDPQSINPPAKKKLENKMTSECPWKSHEIQRRAIRAKNNQLGHHKTHKFVESTATNTKEEDVIWIQEQNLCGMREKKGGGGQEWLGACLGWKLNDGSPIKNLGGASRPDCLTRESL